MALRDSQYCTNSFGGEDHATACIRKYTALRSDRQTSAHLCNSVGNSYWHVNEVLEELRRACIEPRTTAVH